MVLVDSTWEDARMGCPDGTQCKVRLLNNRPIPPPKDTVTQADKLSSERRKFLEENFINPAGSPKITAPFNKLLTSLQEARLWAVTRAEHWEGGGNEYLADEFAYLYEQRRTNPNPLGNSPLIVLTRGRSGYPTEVASTMEPERQLGQKQLTELSTNSRQIIATNSGHRIQFDDPELVACAIREVTEAARRKVDLAKNTSCMAN